MHAWPVVEYFGGICAFYVNGAPIHHVDIQIPINGHIHRAREQKLISAHDPYDRSAIRGQFLDAAILGIHHVDIAILIKGKSRFVRKFPQSFAFAARDEVPCMNAGFECSLVAVDGCAP